MVLKHTLNTEPAVQRLSGGGVVLQEKHWLPWYSVSGRVGGSLKAWTKSPSRSFVLLFCGG